MELLKIVRAPGARFLGVILAWTLVSACSSSPRVVVAHPGGPLLPSLYVAEKDVGVAGQYEFPQFDQSSDIALALANGKLDAGFVDPATVKYLKERNLLSNLTIVGKVEFAYGATAVLNKKFTGDFDTSVKGLRIAIESPDCVLGQSFLAESERRGIDPKAYHVVYLPFADMVAALDADKVDIIVSRPAYAAIATGLGHRVIYKNYDVPADSCCPATLNQLALVLLARTSSVKAVTPLVTTLLNKEDTVSRKDLRQAVATKTGIALDVLDQFSLATFSAADEKLLHLIQKQITDEESEAHD